MGVEPPEHNANEPCYRRLDLGRLVRRNRPRPANLRTDFSGLLGTTWSFTESGDTSSTRMGLNQIQDGKIVYLKAIG